MEYNGERNKAIFALKFALSKGYRIDEEGYACSLKGERLKTHKDSTTGRFTFHVWLPGRVHATIPVHRMVAFQKFGDSMFGPGIEVRHLNNNSLDNSINNIAIGTHKENMSDLPEEWHQRNRERLREEGKKGTAMVRRFTDIEEEEIRTRNKAGEPYSKLMKEFGITSKGTISYITNKKVLRTAQV